MTENVVKLVPDSVGEGYRFDADDILDGAKARGFGSVVVIGEMPDGELWVSSAVGAGEALILIEKAKHQIIFGEG